MIAIIVTRPIPLLSETTAIMAGTSDMSYRQMFISSLAGTLPAAALYALTGSLAVTINSTVWSFTLVLLIAGLFWFLRKPLNMMLMDTVES